MIIGIVVLAVAVFFAVRVVQRERRTDLEQRAAAWAAVQFHREGIKYLTLDCSLVLQTSPPAVDCLAIRGTYGPQPTTTLPMQQAVALDESDLTNPVDPTCSTDPGQTYTGGPPGHFVPPCRFGAGPEFGQVARR